MKVPQQLILIDGECVLCHGLVQWIEKRSDTRFWFGSLQSDKALALRNQLEIDPEVDSIVYLENNKAYFYSDAILKIALGLKFPWRLMFLFVLVPRFLRDWIYRIVARRRYRWFGKKEVCEMPGAVNVWQ